jgi:broad specificity phosphatase PhoE
MMRLILIRHGETDWNVEGRWQGQVDMPLNEHGRQQAVEIAQKLIKTSIQAIYSSDLQRAYQTAEVLARLKGLPIHTDKRLREIHQGKWQGLHISEIQARYTQEFQRLHEYPLEIAPPGGETALQVQQRALAAIEDIIQKHPGITVAIISHGFTLATILSHFREIPFNQVWELIPQNGSILTLEVEM